MHVALERQLMVPCPMTHVQLLRNFVDLETVEVYSSHRQKKTQAEQNEIARRASSKRSLLLFQLDSECNAKTLASVAGCAGSFLDRG